MILLPLILSACLGAAFFGLMAHPLVNRRYFVALASILCLPFGIGISSVLYFLLVQSIGVPFAYAEALEILIAVALVFMWRRKAATAMESSEVLEERPPNRWLRSAFVLTAISALISFLSFIRQMPDGAWDAFGIYNLKARFIFRLPEGWVDMISTRLGYSHMEYPLLLSDAVTRCWYWIGRDANWVPAVIGAAYTVCTAGALVGALREARGLAVALIGGIFLVGTPIFVQQGAGQVADVPLSFYYLVTTVALWLYYRAENPDPAALVLAGCSAALAAWTKNEGDVFFIALLVAVFVFPRRGQSLKARSCDIGNVLKGAAPALLAIIVFKAVFSGPSLVEYQLSWDAVLTRLRDLPRWVYIFKRVAAGIIGFGGWPLNPVVLVLAGISVTRMATRAHHALLPMATLLMITLFAYVGIYLIAPASTLEWLINSSMDRLLLQLWPSWIFAVLATNPPVPDGPLVCRPATT